MKQDEAEDKNLILASTGMEIFWAVIGMGGGVRRVGSGHTETWGRICGLRVVGLSGSLHFPQPFP